MDSSKALTATDIPTYDQLAAALRSLMAYSPYETQRMTRAEYKAWMHAIRLVERLDAARDGGAS